MEAPVFSEKILMELESSPDFPLIPHLEGPDKINLRHIKEKTNVEISLQGGRFSGLDENSPLSFLIASTDADNLAKAKTLCQSLIDTIKAQKAKVEQNSYSKKIKKRKNNQKFVDLPPQLLYTMRYYFPGESAQPPPPGSAKDMKIHKYNFPHVGKKMHWFQKQ